MTLAIADLAFGYRRGATTIIEGLSASFASGSMTAVTGQSGSGKSTLLYLLGLMLRPVSGRIRDDTNDLSRLNDAARAEWRATRTGFIFQDAVLDPARTILDNVCEGGFYAGIPSRVLQVRATKLLEQAGVVARFNHRPGEISGGQAQRVALCRALVKDPAVVLADEPSGNLDSDSADVVWAMLRQAAADGACVVVATHDRARAETCDGRLTL